MNRSIRPLLGLVAALVACSTPTPTAPIEELAGEADPRSRRQPPAGALVGSEVRPGVHAWAGIPFAQPPLGELRWRAPRPPEPWQGTRRALRFGSQCAQVVPRVWTNDDGGRITGSEDCLYLNVYAPRFEPDAVPSGDARRPVMVWIHGGGNTIGSASSYDPSLLVERHGVVAVTVNYRLGALGWFRHPALRAGSSDPLDQSGNFGTLDLVRALGWVQANVAAFGGDPGNVTIFGESAGGLDVITLLLAPQAAGLFHRAISQSGGTWSSTPAQAENWRDDPDPGRVYSSREVLARLLIADGRAADTGSARALLAGWSHAEVARYLRGQPTARLLELFTGDDVSFDTLPLVFREGTVLPTAPLGEAFAAGAHHRVPTLLGTNRDETKLFFMMDPERVRRWFGFYLTARDGDRYQRDAEYGSAAWKADGADEIAIAMRRVQGPSVWVYRFDWDEEPRPLGMDLPGLIGAAHAIEIPFVFGTFDMALFGPLLSSGGNEAGRLELSGKIMSYWAQFAYGGDPGRGRDGSLPAWTPWDDSNAESPRFLVLDTEAGGGLRMSADYVTTERVVERLWRDARFSGAERCEQLARIAERRAFASEALAAGCPAVAAGP